MPGLLLGASSFAIAHNHPSGDCSPSPQDLSFTRRIKEADGPVVKSHFMRPSTSPFPGARLLAAALALTTGLSCNDREPPRPENVLFVLVDTLRADHLGTYGYERQTSPFIDSLASQGVLFEDVTSAAPATFPAVNSLLTSRTPDHFYRTSSRDFGIPESLTTLAEVFHEAGLYTAAISPSPVVRREPSFFNPDGGFGQGFASFDESCGYAKQHVPSFTSDCVLDRAREFFDARELHGRAQPFFLYLHFLDPHDPYGPPASARRFSRDYKATSDFVNEGRTGPLTRMWFGGGEPVPFTTRDLEHFIDLYDDEIRAVDQAIGDLLTDLEARGVLDKTLVVLVSDHGESFLEHPRAWQHGRSLYQTELHVPLIFRWPAGLPKGERRPEPVCSVDVMPTILDLMGVPAPRDMVGVALFGPRRARRPGESRTCFAAGRADWRAQNANLLALRDGPNKIIFDRIKDRHELYDLEVDPDETEDLSPGDWSDATEATALLRKSLDALAEHPLVKSPVALDDQAESALQALGYIE